MQAYENPYTPPHNAMKNTAHIIASAVSNAVSYREPYPGQKWKKLGITSEPLTHATMSGISASGFRGLNQATLLSSLFREPTVTQTCLAGPL